MDYLIKDELNNIDQNIEGINVNNNKLSNYLQYSSS